MSFLIPLTLLLTPTYVIKVSVFSLPTNILMLWIFLVWIIFLVYLIKKNLISQFLTTIKKSVKYIWIFLLGASISLFFGGLNQKTLGEYLVLFIQPISLYFIANFIVEKYPNTKYQILNILYVMLGAAGAYAILQYYFNLNLPLLFQGNDFEPRRAVSFFLHPNFYALWSAPLLAFLLPDVASQFSILNFKFSKTIKPALWVTGVIGLLLSLSRAGWLGLAASALVYLIASGDKKIRSVFYYCAIVGIIFMLFVPSIRHRLTSPFTGEKSASSRITLWQSGIKAIKQSPVFGLGLGGYSLEYRKLITDQTLPDHNFPHNIFLDLWVETGLMGLIGMVGLIGTAIYQGLIGRKNLFKLSVALFFIAFLFQGQIDNPYFKNDLAAVFWIILAII